MANTLKFGNGNWATKKGSTLAYNDLNSNYKPLPFNFSRASKATVINKDGLIEEVGSGQPRVDYKDDSKGALLLEPSRSNLVTYSEDFSQSVWSTWQSTKTLSNNINPKGTNGYYEISHTGSSSDNPNTRLTNVSLNGSYTLSFFIKINQSRYISLSIEDYNGDRARVYFDTINKTFTTITNVGSPITNTSYSEFSNGWIRISLSVNLLNAVYDEVGIGIYNPSGSFPSASGEVISVFGSQLEQGSYATSYIPTSGSAVTRLADVCNNGGNEQVINSTEGVLYFEGSALADGSVDKRIYIDDGTMNNYVAIGYSRFAGNIISEIISGGVLQTVNWGATGVNQTNNNKFALSWGSGTMKFYVNGTQTNTESVTSPTGLNVLEFNTSINTLFMEANVKDVRVYNTTLTDAELQALTQV